ncbi:hypothetical protein BDZ97DRAFT_195922 [Flammula alnicola]|nr:hypothetical protein BDZ97DRAFT_195922 [Flammula alnicola]
MTFVISMPPSIPTSSQITRLIQHQRQPFYAASSHQIRLPEYLNQHNGHTTMDSATSPCHPSSPCLSSHSLYCSDMPVLKGRLTRHLKTNHRPWKDLMPYRPHCVLFYRHMVSQTISEWPMYCVLRIRCLNSPTTHRISADSDRYTRAPSFRPRLPIRRHPIHHNSNNTDSLGPSPHLDVFHFY